MKKKQDLLYCQVLFILLMVIGYKPLFSLEKVEAVAAVFCLHDIDGQGKYSLKSSQLKELLALLVREKYEVISLSAWQKKIALGESPKPTVILTFDDGYPSLLKIVVPLLRQYNVGATFYIYSERYRENSEFFQELAKLPLEFEIGSHALAHEPMVGMSQQQFYQELYLSRLKLAYLTGREIYSFAWPYGVYRPEYIELAFQAGYLSQVSVEHRLARASDLKRIVPRFTLTQPNPLEQARKVLKELNKLLK